MSVLTDNAFPLLCMVIPLLIALKLEYSGKHKLFWGTVAVILTAVIAVYLAIIGADARVILLSVLVPLFVVLI